MESPLEALAPELLDYWRLFRKGTLARLNLSYLPMVDMLVRNRSAFETVGSFGSGSCTHEVALSLMFPGVHVHCYDATDRYIPDYTRPYFEQGNQLVFHQYDFSTPLEDQFDLVFSIQTLEHIQDFENALDGLCRAVRRGGYLYIDTPLFHERPDAEPDYDQLMSRAWDKHEHYHLGFSRLRMEERLRDRGFAIVDSGYYCYFHFDQAVMDMVRESDDREAWEDAGMKALAKAMLRTLRGAEAAFADRKDELDQLPVYKRKCAAIRVLARNAGSSE